MPSNYKCRYYISLLIAYALLLSVSPVRTAKADEPHLDKLTAEDVIRRMAQVYVTSESYRDEGVVRSVIISADETRTIEKPFKTAFVRPDRFRFEYIEKKSIGNNSHYIAYRNRGELKTYWNIGPEMVREFKTLGESLAGAAGISSGTSRTVPTMLIPTESQFRNAIIYYDPQRIEDTVVDGVDCFSISDPAKYSRLTLWVGKKDFLLRKVYREQEFNDFRLQETTTYIPILNGKVTDKMLEFNPPE